MRGPASHAKRDNVLDHSQRLQPHPASSGNRARACTHESLFGDGQTTIYVKFMYHFPRKNCNTPREKNPPGSC
jgi:hypothetical protein